MQSAQTAAPALKTLTLPAIGQHWPEHGGIFAGIVAAQDCERDYLLILGPEAPDELNWKQAIDWAATLNIDGHTDFTLPNRNDGGVLYGNLKSLFQPEWYWLSAQYAGDDAYAWFQSFHYGDQSSYRKYYQLRARAVRRSII